MHLVGDPSARWSSRNSSLPIAVTKAFEQAKAAALVSSADTSATKVTLPFVEEQLKSARELMGRDFWSYGVAANRSARRFPAPSSCAGIVVGAGVRRKAVHPATLESFKL